MDCIKHTQLLLLVLVVLAVNAFTASSFALVAPLSLPSSTSHAAGAAAASAARFTSVSLKHVLSNRLYYSSQSDSNEGLSSRAGGIASSSFDESPIDKLLRSIKESDSNLTGKISVDAKQVVYLMSKATKNRQWKKSLELFKCVAQRGDPVLNVFLGNAALSALSKGRMIGEMRVYFDLMKGDGIAPNVVTFNTMIDALGKNNHVQKMKHMFSDMKYAGVAPDVITYSALISALGEDGKIREIKKMFSEMKDAKITPDLKSYNCVINALRKNGQVREMKQMLDDMKEAGLTPDDVTNLAYNPNQNTNNGDGS
jgi:pentatricopeptide repeat protein